MNGVRQYAPIDWQRVCLQLRNRYKPLAAVAVEIGADPAHLRRLARGEVQEPRFTVGIRLMNLHDQAMSIHAITQFHVNRWKQSNPIKQEGVSPC